MILRGWRSLIDIGGLATLAFRRRGVLVILPRRSRHVIVRMDIMLHGVEQIVEILLRPGRRLDLGRGRGCRRGLEAGETPDDRRIDERPAGAGHRSHRRSRLLRVCLERGPARFGRGRSLPRRRFRRQRYDRRWHRGFGMRAVEHRIEFFLEAELERIVGNGGWLPSLVCRLHGGRCRQFVVMCIGAVAHGGVESAREIHIDFGKCVSGGHGRNGLRRRGSSRAIDIRLGKIETIKLEFRLKFQFTLKLEFGRQIQLGVDLRGDSVIERCFIERGLV